MNINDPNKETKVKIHTMLLTHYCMICTEIYSHRYYDSNNKMCIFCINYLPMRDTRYKILNDYKKYNVYKESFKEYVNMLRDGVIDLVFYLRKMIRN